MKFEIPDFSRANLLVVGDVMLDRYWRGNTSRISPEAPVPVVNVKEVEERPGGAGNVALNLAALGSKASLLSMVGDDAFADKLTQLLTQQHIQSHMQRVPSLPTISKLRVLDRNQQLLRVDFEQAFTHIPPTELLAMYEQQLLSANMVILSDYNKGVLQCAPQLIAKAQAAGVPVLVDPKTNDFSLYNGATVVTPNLKEFFNVVGPCYTEQEIEEKGKALMQAHDIKALLITRSEQGMTLLRYNQAPLNLATRAREVYDVTGAGDTVIAVLGAALAAGQSLPDAATLANTAAGIVVRKSGAATTSVPELRRAMQRQFDSELGVLSEGELLLTVEDARAHGEEIVMTNGCFDLLHPGHIAYLEQAKALGKRLIVAINDDASVQRLKGASRPINSLEQRMTIVAALRSVDWVVPFSEDTPARLIARILPDVLVKGGDYEATEVAGGDAVVANGGQVKILQFVEGYSSSDMIKKIKGESICLS